MGYGNPTITENYILCEECGKLMKKLTANHLKLHKLTIPEYKRKWGLTNNQPLEALYIKKLRQEYSKKYKTHKKNLLLTNSKYQFKKGHKRIHVIREQDKIRLRKMCVNVQSTEKFKLTISKAAKKVWQREGYRAKYILTIKEKWKTDSKDFKERMKNQSKTYWNRLKNN